MSLRAKATSGVKWMSVAVAATAVLSFLQTAVLSRLLEPRDFGLIAMIWVVLGFLQTFSDMGVANALVQRQDVTARQLSSVYWLTAATGALMSLLAMASAPLLAAFYREPELAKLTPWAAAGFLFTALGQPFQMLAQRDLYFRRLAAGEMLSSMTAFCTAVAAAWMGAGALALVVAGLASSALRAAYFATLGWSSWRPSAHFARADLAGFLRFGAYQLGERTANYIWNNADYMLVGRMLGAGPLGIYRLAYETVIRPLSTVNPVLNTVSYPLFSKKQHDNEALRRGYLELVRLAGALAFPLMAGLAAVAPEAVAVVFGTKWAEAAPIMQILATLGALRSITNPVGALLMAKGLVNISFWGNLGQGIVSVAAFMLAAPYGIRPLAWTALGVMVAVVVVSWKFYYHDSIRLPLGDWLRALRLPALISVAMGLAVSALVTALAAEPASVRLAAGVASGAALYALLFVLFDRAYVLEVWKLLAGRRS